MVVLNVGVVCSSSSTSSAEQHQAQRAVAGSWPAPLLSKVGVHADRRAGGWGLGFRLFDYTLNPKKNPTVASSRYKQDAGCAQRCDGVVLALAVPIAAIGGRHHLHTCLLDGNKRSEVAVSSTPGTVPSRGQAQAMACTQAGAGWRSPQSSGSSSRACWCCTVLGLKTLHCRCTVRPAEQRPAVTTGCVPACGEAPPLR